MPRFFNDTLTANDLSRTRLGPRILCAGLPRCATSSMQVAVESEYINAGPCMHMAHVIPNVPRSDLTIAILSESNRDKRHKMIRQLFDDFDATSDYPGSLFMDDLMDIYPDAKIVLNKRPGGAEAWTKSIKILSFTGSKLHYAIKCLWKTDRNLYTIWWLAEEMMKDKLGITAADFMTVKNYEIHNAWIRAEAAKRGRPVLEFEPADGWEPLCKFVGVKPPPPGTPFPRTNDAAEVIKIKRILLARGVISWLALFGAAAGVYGWFFRR